MSSVWYFTVTCIAISTGASTGTPLTGWPTYKVSVPLTVESWASWTVITNDERVNGGGLIKRYRGLSRKGLLETRGSCVHGATNKLVRKTEVSKQVLESAHSYRVSCGQKPRSRIPYKAIGEPHLCGNALLPLKAETTPLTPCSGNTSLSVTDFWKCLHLSPFSLHPSTVLWSEEIVHACVCDPAMS